MLAFASIFLKTIHITDELLKEYITIDANTKKEIPVTIPEYLNGSFLSSLNCIITIFSEGVGLAYRGGLAFLSSFIWFSSVIVPLIVVVRVSINMVRMLKKFNNVQNEKTQYYSDFCYMASQKGRFVSSGNALGGQIFGFVWCVVFTLVNVVLEMVELVTKTNVIVLIVYVLFLSAWVVLQIMVRNFGKTIFNKVCENEKLFKKEMENRLLQVQNN